MVELYMLRIVHVAYMYVINFSGLDATFIVSKLRDSYSRALVGL